MMMKELNEMIARVAQPRTREVFEWMLDSEEERRDRADPEGMSVQDLNDLIASVAQRVRELKDIKHLEWMLGQEEHEHCGPHLDDLMSEEANEFTERLAA